MQKRSAETLGRSAEEVAEPWSALFTTGKETV